MTLANGKTSTYKFLNEMEHDNYYPPQLVAKGKFILQGLCLQIEAQRPQTLEQLFQLTHEATEQFNRLSDEFDEQGSELETVARENIAKDVDFIAQAYGFHEDLESLIQNREW
ncbi:DUF5713 family protein (plasmid) [Deinococcus sp. KNUC1210]|uniref:DUF5713 family protein n=1 Tax=Deinococcus sp. KNUC1210 TaxID=2917691 RepID=UPI001EEF928E|nr:DUF5713 family protein [Deinococcus sp. KNUC1210]ULH13985.1 DUF5713 family protein [Deinococcus sp. KNUC1210]